MNITEKDWNELKSMILEIRGSLSILVDEAGKELLTPNEICKMLKISRNTFQNYINRNVFKHSKVEGRVYVKRSEIERLIDEGII
ncbi:helix-turn-helix domain-containing protein [Parabacteroides timonensis]|uniref:helix-turn-helix domain-containing protein n=1 Tax=Parabacteroides timonensis TaxID=1871013 RepID=UPI00094E8AD3|nr:helix-turn-helix domain-containing protein [Parabacteroides timonensis]